MKTKKQKQENKLHPATIAIIVIVGMILCYIVFTNVRNHYYVEGYTDGMDKGISLFECSLYCYANTDHSMESCIAQCSDIVGGVEAELETPEQETNEPTQDTQLPALESEKTECGEEVCEVLELEAHAYVPDPLGFDLIDKTLVHGVKRSLKLRGVSQEPHMVEGQKAIIKKYPFYSLKKGMTITFKPTEDIIVTDKNGKDHKVKRIVHTINETHFNQPTPYVVTQPLNQEVYGGYPHHETITINHNEDYYGIYRGIVVEVK